MAQVKTVEITVKLRVAVGVESSAYRPNHIDMHLDATQSEALKALHVASVNEPQKLAAGRWVQTPPDVVRHLLEQVAAAMSPAKT